MDRPLIDIPTERRSPCNNCTVNRDPGNFIMSLSGCSTTLE